jgi:hypothetical protein
MRYAIINPKKQTLRAIDASSFEVALDAAELADVGRDHSMVTRQIGIVVYEYALYVPPAEQHYFALNGKLYGGNALLYACNETGETIDLTICPEPTFFKSADDVEAAIYMGKVERPIVALDDRIVWKWPDPQPE